MYGPSFSIENFALMASRVEIHWDLLLLFFFLEKKKKEPCLKCSNWPWRGFLVHGPSFSIESFALMASRVEIHWDLLLFFFFLEKKKRTVFKVQ